MPKPIKDAKGFHVNFRHRGRRFRNRFEDYPSAQDFIDRVMAGEGLEGVPLPDLVSRYLSRAARLGIKRESTIKADRQRLGVFLDWCDFAGVSRITRITIREFQDYYFENAPFYPPHHRRTANVEATWEKYRQILSAFCNWLVERGLLESNPLAGPPGREFRIRRRRSLPGRILASEEIDRVLSHLDCRGLPQISAFYRLALYTGMRSGEIVGLPWSDVDFELGVITVRQSIRGDTKTGRERGVPIHERLRPSLEALPRVGPLVLDNGHGRPFYHPNHWWRLLRETSSALGIEPVRVHDLRHTFASHLVMAGVDLVTVQRLLGHSNIQMTIETYSHLAPKHLSASVSKLGY